jgi:pimeloyl-ACP methyl ester carboxylesterase
MRQPLILVPGLTCTAALWAPQVAGLADVADIAIADHTTADTMAGIASAILAKAPAQFALAGLSMGGYIAFEMLRQAPARITRLALLDTSAKPFDAAHALARQALIAKARTEGMAPVMRELLPMFLHPARLAEPNLVDTVVQMGRDTGPDVFARQQAALMGRPDSQPTLAAIRCPTLALTGAQDLLTPPAEHLAIAEAVPGCVLEIIPDCGHLSTLERPEAVNAVLRRWLAG